MPYVSGVGLDSAALGMGLAGAFLVLALAVCLVKLYIAPSLRITRQVVARPATGARAELDVEHVELDAASRSLHALLRSCVELLGPLAREKGLKLELAISPQLPDAVELDARRMHRILVDLIRDAIQFTHQGWVKVHVDGVGLTEPRFALRIRIEDTSGGVSGADEPRSDDKALVRAREAGSHTFELVIPALRRTQPNPAPAQAPAPPLLVPLRLPSPGAPILVVDDDELDRTLALELLEQLGFETEAATGGAQAVALVCRSKFALVLMDCEMPGVDGYAAARRIRELAAPQHLPIIACAAPGPQRENARVLQAGMNDCLSKPLERADLCRVLAMHLPDERNPASSGTRLRAARATNMARQAATANDLPDLVARHRSERLVDLFVTQVPDELHALAIAADMGRPDELARRAAKLEKTCLGCGAMKMAAACAALAQPGQRSKENLAAQLEALQAAFLVVMALLGEARPLPESAPAPSTEHNPEAP